MPRRWTGRVIEKQAGGSGARRGDAVRRLVVEPLIGGRPEIALAALESKGERWVAGDVLRVSGTTASRIAAAGTAYARLFDVMERYGVDPDYPDAVLEETRAWVASATDLATPAAHATGDVSTVASSSVVRGGSGECDDAGGVDRDGERVDSDAERVDLTDIPFVSIDGPGARDLDQALHIAMAQDADTRAQWIVRYAIADASHYVTAGSALLDEALERGASYYLASVSVPMLPPALSEGIVSLNPDVVRRAVVFEMPLDADGKPLEPSIHRAWIRSRAGLTYQEVQRFHDAPNTSPLRGAEFAESLTLMRTVGELRMALERERDVVQFNRTELAISLCPSRRAASEGTAPIGETLRVEERERNDVERWNEQISLLCNMLGARILRARAGEVDDGVGQPIFRVHPAPDHARVDKLTEVLDAIIEAQSIDPDIWRWRRDGPDGETLADYLERLPSEGTAGPIRAAIERQVLYVNQASEFSPFAGPHHALGIDEYARFSAPMREVVGIVTHKEALEMLGYEPSREAAADEALRERVIEIANQARRRQRRLDKATYELALDQILGDELARNPDDRTIFAGTILGARRSRLYVRFSSPPLEIKLYRRHLEEALSVSLVLEPNGMALRCDTNPSVRLAVGDRIHVRVAGYEGDPGRWRFAPVAGASDSRVDVDGSHGDPERSSPTHE